MQVFSPVAKNSQTDLFYSFLPKLSIKFCEYKTRLNNNKRDVREKTKPHSEVSLNHSVKVKAKRWPTLGSSRSAWYKEYVNQIQTPYLLQIESFCHCIY